MTIRSFENPEDMFGYLQKSREEADARVDTEQASIQIGDYFCYVVDDLVIYGEVLDPCAPQLGIQYSPEDLEEIKAEGEVYKTAGMKHFRFTRCYSVVVPEGEIGDVHVSSVFSKLTSMQFDAAKKTGWPTDVLNLKALLNIQPTGSA